MWTALTFYNLLQAKREKEEAKALRRRNTKRLTEILDRMTDIKYNTTWEQVRSFKPNFNIIFNLLLLCQWSKHIDSVIKN